MSKSATRYTSDQMTLAYKRLERQQDTRGEWWIAPCVAAERTGYCKLTLKNWSDPKGGGCVVMENRTLRRKRFPYGPGGRTARFYAEAQIEELITTVSNIPINPHLDGFVSIAEAASQYKVGVSVQMSLRGRGRLEVQYVQGRTRIGRVVREQPRVSIKDLKAFRDSLGAEPAQADKLTLRQAAGMLGMSKSGLESLVRRKGITTYPGTFRVNGSERSCLRVDRAVIEGEQQTRGPAKDKPVQWGGFNWCRATLLNERTGLDIGNKALINYVSVLFHYRTVTCPFLDGREAGRGHRFPDVMRPVLALLLPANGGGTWYYNEEDARLIKGRLDGSITAEQARTKAAKILTKCHAALRVNPVTCNFGALSGVQPIPAAQESPADEPEAPTEPAAGRRGPRKSDRTGQVYKRCYEKMAAGKDRRVIIRELNTEFPDPMYRATLPKEVSVVTTYARRWAQDPDNNLPWPLRNNRK